MILLCKGISAPVALLLKEQGGNYIVPAVYTKIRESERILASIGDGSVARDLDIPFCNCICAHVSPGLVHD